MAMTLKCYVCVQMVTVDHYTVVREPGGEYKTHFTPTTGKDVDIGAEMVSVVS